MERAVNKFVSKEQVDTEVIQIRKIGNSVGLILPKELLARLKLKEGDKLHLTEEPERGFKLSPYDPKHAEAMRIAREVMDEYQDTFRALAK
jgi:putative addiction module antidote